MGAKRKVNRQAGSRRGGGSSQESSLNQIQSTAFSGQITQIKEIVNQLEINLDVKFEKICKGLDEDFEFSKSQLDPEDAQKTLDEYIQSGKNLFDLPITTKSIQQIINKKQSTNNNKKQISKEEKLTHCTEQMLQEIQNLNLDNNQNKRYSKGKITPSKIDNNNICDGQNIQNNSNENNKSREYMQISFRNERGSLVGSMQVRENIPDEEIANAKKQFENFWKQIEDRRSNN